MLNDELYHHGVKGMKWGQHIFGKKSSGGVSKARTVKTNKLKGFINTQKKKSAKYMTDAELEKAIARRKKENEYKMLKGEVKRQQKQIKLQQKQTELQQKQQKQQQKQQQQQKNQNGQKQYEGFFKQLYEKSKTSAVTALTTATQNAGQAYIEKKLRGVLGLNQLSEHDRYKEASETARYKTIIDNYNRSVAERNGEAEAARKKAYDDGKKAAEAAMKSNVNDVIKAYYEAGRQTTNMLLLPGPTYDDK